MVLKRSGNCSRRNIGERKIRLVRCFDELEKDVRWCWCVVAERKGPVPVDS